MQKSPSSTAGWTEKVENLERHCQLVDLDEARVWVKVVYVQQEHLQLSVGAPTVHAETPRVQFKASVDMTERDMLSETLESCCQ